MSNKDASFPDIVDLSKEQKEDCVKQLYLYGCKMRDEDRRMVINQNNQNFASLFKIVITLSGAALGGSALSGLPQYANKTQLVTAWVFFILSIVFISIELICSMIQTDKYQAGLAKNDGAEVSHPGNTAIFILISLSVFCMIAGLSFIIISLANGK
ncbi:MAG: hypothetical protein IJB89_07680 [Akkermansia sp.]|nr:hypothetical protein [Akkermansia sp.]